MPPSKKQRLIDVLGSPDCALAKFLIKKWAWGLYSAHEIHEIAKEALADQKALLKSLGVADNFASKSLDALAHLGADGKFDGNLRRDLLSQLGDPPVPEPVSVKSPNDDCQDLARGSNSARR